MMKEKMKSSSYCLFLSITNIVIRKKLNKSFHEKDGLLILLDLLIY